MILRAGFSALIVTAVLTFSGCSAPPIATEVSTELQSEVHEIAVLTARGDTSDAVEAAHALSTRVRTAQAEGKISGERAVIILQRVEQLIDRLTRSGAAPAPADQPQPLAGPAAPAAPVASPSAEPGPAITDGPEPTVTDAPEPPAEPPQPPEPAGPAPVAENGGDSSGSNSGSGSGEPVPDTVVVDAADEDDDDDDSGRGRGRGRGRGGGD
ncbi:hypothetical protein [uncultured Arthrobacter sp.]|uniref:hypothetical protein n=1 Tax=uncultured Arthrobacter sp. TaxID=114050 RepID=UPI002627306B|nr:hypothetical protein [uncultured Arthrobacter sp.]